MPKILPFPPPHQRPSGLSIPIRIRVEIGPPQRTDAPLAEKLRAITADYRREIVKLLTEQAVDRSGEDA